MAMLESWQLEQRQSLPLEQKIALTKRRIAEFFKFCDGEVYVAYSGGKDSTVLVDLVRNSPGVYNVPVVFVDTGLEYPEVRKMAIKNADVVLKPRKTFKQVIDEYGYPVISKEQAQYIRQARTSTPKMRELRINGSPETGRFRISKKWLFMLDAPFKISERCCDVMKKAPFKKYEKQTGKKPIIGTMACESSLRKQEYIKHGCNMIDNSRPKSSPLGFWTEQDILHYIKKNNLQIPSVYGEIIQTDLFGEELKLSGVQRTGCMFCMFGVHYEHEPNRFQRMKETHPKQYEYCINNLGCGAVLSFMGVGY